MTGLKLIEVSFDNLENGYAEAICREELGVFVDGDKLTAHGKVEEFLRTLEPRHPYLGYDGEVYPQFKVERVQIK